MSPSCLEFGIAPPRPQALTGILKREFLKAWAPKWMGFWGLLCAHSSLKLAKSWQTDHLVLFILGTPVALSTLLGTWWGYWKWMDTDSCGMPGRVSSFLWFCFLALRAKLRRITYLFLFIARADSALELAVPNSFTFSNTEVSFLVLPPSVIR